jgi:tRNA(fMet)-specific endonuclease VapC
MPYLLDTNIVSDAMRNPDGRTAACVLRAGKDNVATSIIVAAELRFGIAKRASQALAGRLDALFAEIAVLPFDAPADRFYADIRTRLERRGTPIGGNDLFIAAHALALGAVLVTGNDREFSHIEGLKLENWLR